MLAPITTRTSCPGSAMRPPLAGRMDGRMLAWHHHQAACLPGITTRTCIPASSPVGTKRAAEEGAGSGKEQGDPGEATQHLVEALRVLRAPAVVAHALGVGRAVQPLRMCARRSRKTHSNARMHSQAGYRPLIRRRGEAMRRTCMQACVSPAARGTGLWALGAGQEVKDTDAPSKHLRRSPGCRPR